MPSLLEGGGPCRSGIVADNRHLPEIYLEPAIRDYGLAWEIFRQGDSVSAS